METSNKFNKKIKLIIFDQYGTIVDMQKGLTEAVIPFLKKKKWDGDPNRFVTWWRRTQMSILTALLRTKGSGTYNCFATALALNRARGHDA